MNTQQDNWLIKKLEADVAESADRDYFNTWTETKTPFTADEIMQLAGHAGPQFSTPYTNIKWRIDKSSHKLQNAITRSIYNQVINVIQTRGADVKYTEIGASILPAMQECFSMFNMQELENANEALAVYLKPEYCLYFDQEVHLRLLKALGYKALPSIQLQAFSE